MDADQLKTTLLGFGGAIAVLAVLLYLVGVGDLVSTLSRANLDLVAVVVAVTVAWLAAWSLALRTVLAVLGVDLSASKAFLVFSGAMFNNNVTPFGQAGGEPVTALLISRTADAEYETGLAAIASVDTLNFVPSITLALIGAGYYATEVTFSRDLRIATGAVVALAVVVPLAVYYGWKNRYSLEHRVVDTLTPAIRWVAGFVPGVSAPDAGGVERRIGRFFQAIERVATNPRGLALALGLSALGWLFQMVGLWLAFQALEINVPLSVMMFIVPMGAIAGITPLPGGAGGIESVLVVLLVAAPLPTVTESVALAAVIIYRGAVYWVPVVIGGTVMSVVGVGGVGRAR
ncbi:MAG: YbhN family protein [Haloarculaceae archaeon]